MSLFLLAGLLAAVALWRQDALVALGQEVWVGPALLLLIHLLIGALLRWPLRRWRAGRGVLLALPLALMVSWSWRWTEAPARPDTVSPVTSRPHVVLLSLDTFRADHMGPDTPNLQALAAQNISYTNAVTTAPLTAPAHASMLSGLASPEHGLLANGRSLQVASVVSRLHAAGFRTGAFLSARVLDRNTGLSKDFMHYDDRWGYGQRLAWWPLLTALDLPSAGLRRSGDRTIARALQWLNEETTPAFLWVHLYDAHAPYQPPEAWRPSPDAIAEARALDRAQRSPDKGFIEGLFRNRVHQQMLMYRAAVGWTDHLIGALMAALPPDARVIIVGDHGENLNEHDYFLNHGARLWEESLRVPFVVRWPGAPPQQVDALISVQAVAGLIAAAAGLEEGGAIVSEERVLSYTTGQQARHAAGTDGRPQPAAALRWRDTKLVQHGATPPQYYDLLADPAEQRPLPVPAALQPAADEISALIGRPVPPLAEEAKKRLELLGYVE